MKGAAKVQGKPVKTMLLVLGTPNGKALIVRQLIDGVCEALELFTLHGRSLGVAWGHSTSDIRDHQRHRLALMQSAAIDRALRFRAHAPRDRI